MEAQLVEYVRGLREKRFHVTHKMLWAQARRAFEERVTDEPERFEGVTFTASCGWCNGFCDWHKLAIQARTTVGSEPASALSRQERRKHRKYALRGIIGCDEKPVWFENVGYCTINTVGAREVTIRSTGHDKTWCTVMLTGKADGTRCKPLVVFKRARPMQGLQGKFRNLAITYSSNGWMNEQLTHIHIDLVIGQLSLAQLPFAQLSFAPRLLVWDAYRCNIMDSTKVKLRTCKVDMAVIPGGCTKFLQRMCLGTRPSRGVIYPL